MSASPQPRQAILMIAYTLYERDTRVMREAEAAAEAGYDVDFLALGRQDTQNVETLHGVRVLRLNQQKYRGSGRLSYLLAYLEFFLRCFFKTTALYFQRRYRAIHVNNMPDFLVFSTLIPKLLGAKIILDIHDPMPNTFVSKFKDGPGGFYFRVLLLQERLSAAYSDQVITVHDPVKEGILVKHGLKPEAIKVIANFADDELFPLRNTFSFEGKIRLVFHGTILERSGLRMLMTALAKVRHKDRVSVKIIGEGDFSSALRELIRANHLQEMVDFDNRSYPARSIAERIADCNVGLVPLEISSVTNFALPLKLIEYVSLGLPVVTVRSNAISYYFGEEDCIYFDWNDPDSLSAALDRIAEHPEMLMHFRERSVALRPRFSWEGEKRKYVELLRDLTRNGRNN